MRYGEKQKTPFHGELWFKRRKRVLLFDENSKETVVSLKGVLDLVAEGIDMGLLKGERSAFRVIYQVVDRSLKGVR